MDEPASAPSHPVNLRFGRMLVGLAVAALLGAVFYLYGNPQLVIMLTDQLWACF